MGLYEKMQQRKLGNEYQEVKNSEEIIVENLNYSIPTEIISLPKNNDENLYHIENGNTESENKILNKLTTINNDEISNPMISIQIDSAKYKIKSTNKLDDLVGNIRFFEKQINYSFFFSAHCFLKIREDRIYKQKGYDNFTDFIKVELKEFSMKNVYNFIKVAKTFSLEQISSDILDLGVTKLILITKIKDKQLRIPFLLNNFDEIKEISSRELDVKILQLNNTQIQTALPDNFDLIIKNHISELKDNVLKLSVFLDEFEERSEDKRFDLLKEEIKEMEEKLKKIKENVILKLPK